MRNSLKKSPFLDPKVIHRKRIKEDKNIRQFIFNEASPPLVCPGRHQPAPSPEPPRESGKGGVMLKGLPCFVSKGQHSKHEKFEVQTMRPPQTLDSRRRRGATTCPGEAVTRSLLLPYRPRHRAAARRRPLAPRCAAPWRGAPGTAQTERRRVAAQRRAPAGRSTITAFSALSWRPRQPAPAAPRPLPGDGGSGFGTLVQRGASWSQPESACRSLARAGLLTNSGSGKIRPPRTLRSSSSFLGFSLNSSPTLRRAFPTRAPTAPRAAASQRTGSLLPALHSGRPGAWLSTRKSWPLGSAGAARDPSAPRCRLPPRLPSALCVRAAKPSAEPFQRRRLGSKRE